LNWIKKLFRLLSFQRKKEMPSIRITKNADKVNQHEHKPLKKEIEITKETQSTLKDSDRSKESNTNNTKELKTNDKRIIIKSMSLTELKHYSNKKNALRENDKLALRINKKIIDKGCKEIEYYSRLARCYKKLDLIDEALDLYQSILRKDKTNIEASDYVQIYGKFSVDSKNIKKGRVRFIRF